MTRALQVPCGSETYGYAATVGKTTDRMPPQKLEQNRSMKKTWKNRKGKEQYRRKGGEKGRG